MTDVERGYRIGETDLRMAIEGMRGFATQLRGNHGDYGDAMADVHEETADRLEADMNAIIEKCNQP